MRNLAVIALCVVVWIAPGLMIAALFHHAQEKPERHVSCTADEGRLVVELTTACVLSKDDGEGCFDQVISEVCDATMR